MATTPEPAAAIQPPPAPPDPTTTAPEFPLPPMLQHHPTTAGAGAVPTELITQGAEGRLYRTSWLTPTRACALKHRPSKPYRHPTLDARLTRHRILSEARILQKCRREGVAVPALYGLDEAQGVLAMEWVPGRPVRVEVNEFLRRRAERYRRRSGSGSEHSSEENNKGREEVARDEEGAAPLVGLMRRVGEAVGKLHKAGIVHGDLTTSNMMVRPWGKDKKPVNGHHPVTPQSGQGEEKEEEKEDGDHSLEGEIVVIDFGLASQGSADEDRAVDLYVLERAFGSTHPRAEALFSVVLEAYKDTFKAAPVVLKKLEDVRMRGRKRSMLG